MDGRPFQFAKFGGFAVPITALASFRNKRLGDNFFRCDREILEYLAAPVEFAAVEAAETFFAMSPQLPLAVLRVYLSKYSLKKLSHKPH